MAHSAAETVPLVGIVRGAASYVAATMAERAHKAAQPRPEAR